MPHRRPHESSLVTALHEEHTYYEPNLRLQEHSCPSKSGRNTPSIALPVNLVNFDSNIRQVTMSLHSNDSQDTAPTAMSIAPLQDVATVEGKQGYSPVDVDDPKSFDLVEPSLGGGQERVYSLENRVDLLFSKAHLEAIFADSRLFLKFTTFLSKHRPQSVPLLIYYLDSVKALKAIDYSNAIIDGLEAVSNAEFTSSLPKSSTNVSLREKADRAFMILTEEDLPAYIAHLLVDIVSTSIHRKITGTMAPQLQQASEGLAEVFCMTDVSKPDNPIVFSSEEFHRTTQYGLNYAVGRNCRFLQGPKTSPFSIQRLRNAVRNGQEHQEILLNYRRDGSPFMNLLTMAPLLDNQGKVRYFIGAQVDVSGLIKENMNLEAMAKLVEEQESQLANGSQQQPVKEKKDEFQALSEMFNQSELETVRVHGGRMHSEQHGLTDAVPVRTSNRPRLLIREHSEEDDYDAGFPGTFTPPPNSTSPPPTIAGKLPGVFTHYLILRPHPSLRITFTSPSLRVPGLLQSPFLSRIGGSGRVREELALALSEGRNVTAKIRWLTERYDDPMDSNTDGYSSAPLTAGKPRWIHCTPLIGANRAVGAWMVIMIDGEDHEQVKMAQAERTSAMSPSWGRSSHSQHSTGSQRIRNPTTRQTQYQADHPPTMGASLNGSEWDLDLDLATASFPQPTTSHIGRATTTNQRIRSHSPALSPPPKSTPPPVPTNMYNENHNNSAPYTSVPQRPGTNSASAKPGPNTFTTQSMPQQQNQQTPAMPKLPTNLNSTPHMTNGVLNATPPLSNNVLTKQNLSQRSNKYASTEDMNGKKKESGFGHRMFNGFLKGSEREREKERLRQGDGNEKK